MPAFKCPSCSSTELEQDPQLGHVVCVGCGQVLELNSMVSELSFSESSKGAASTFFICFFEFAIIWNTQDIEYFINCFPKK